MPIRAELRHLYPADWQARSAHVRFRRARGLCEACKRPHLVVVRTLPDGRWFDAETSSWRDGKGRRLKRYPNLLSMAGTKRTRVVLAACHVDGNASRSGLRNLRAWCQRCHLRHDRRQHQAQRWVTYRARYADGDLFLGSYEQMKTAIAIDAVLAH